MAIIKVKRGTTKPTTSNLPYTGELALNYSTNELYVRSSSEIIKIGGELEKVYYYEGSVSYHQLNYNFDRNYIYKIHIIAATNTKTVDTSNTLINYTYNSTLSTGSYISLMSNDSSSSVTKTSNRNTSSFTINDAYSNSVAPTYAITKVIDFEMSPTFESNVSNTYQWIAYGTGGFTREEFNSLLRLNNHPKITYGSKYLCELRNADYTNLDCMLYFMNSSVEGLDLKIRVRDKSYDFKTNIILPHNSLNITCVISILEALNVFNPVAFNKCISNINIPGREEIIKVKDRTIVIGLSIMPALENFKAFISDDSTVKKVKVLTAGIGTGFVSWDKALSTELYLRKRSSVRQSCMKYVSENADYAYITSNDNAAENPLSIAQEMQGYLNNVIPSVIIVDREEAIRKAIIESEPYDLIYISGRGNRSIFCDSAKTVKLFKDKEVVRKVLKELRW